MEEKKKTIVINRSDAADGGTAGSGGVTTDTIEYTLLVHEVPELMDARREEAPAAGAAVEAESETEEKAAAAVTDETIEYTLLAHEVPELVKEGYTGSKDAAGEAGGTDAEQEPSENAAAADERLTMYGLPAGSPEMLELARKMEERRRFKESRTRLFRTRFYVGITIFVIGIAAAILSVSGIFTVDSIEVRGNSHYSAEEIINMGHAVPGRNLIYHANKDEIEGYLEQNPYIKSAAVSRRFPSTLVITVTEREERLAFGYDDDYLIMDNDGILLKKTRNRPKITLIEGLVVSRIKLGEKIGTEDNKKFNKVLALIRSMIKSDIYFVRVDITKEKRISAYIYDTLVVKTDYDTLMDNMENGRLHLVLEKIFSDGIKRGTITFDDNGTASFQPAI